LHFFFIFKYQIRQNLSAPFLIRKQPEIFSRSKRLRAEDCARQPRLPGIFGSCDFVAIGYKFEYLIRNNIRFITVNLEPHKDPAPSFLYLTHEYCSNEQYCLSSKPRLVFILTEYTGCSCLFSRFFQPYWLVRKKSNFLSSFCILRINMLYYYIV
jgi:hypothetical protein